MSQCHVLYKKAIQSTGNHVPAVDEGSSEEVKGDENEVDEVEVDDDTSEDVLDVLAMPAVLGMEPLTDCRFNKSYFAAAMTRSARAGFPSCRALTAARGDSKIPSLNAGATDWSASYNAASAECASWLISRETDR